MELTAVLAVEGVRQQVLAQFSPLTLLRLMRVSKTSREWAEVALDDCPVLVLLGSACRSNVVPPQHRAVVAGPNPAPAMLQADEEEEEDIGDETSEEDDGEDYDGEGGGSESEDEDDGVGGDEEGDDDLWVDRHALRTFSENEVHEQDIDEYRRVFSLEWRTGCWREELPLAKAIHAPVACSSARDAPVCGWDRASARTLCDPEQWLTECNAGYVFDGLTGAVHRVELRAAVRGPTAARRVRGEVCSADTGIPSQGSSVRSRAAGDAAQAPTNRAEGAAIAQVGDDMVLMGGYLRVDDGGESDDSEEEEEGHCACIERINCAAAEGAAAAGTAAATGDDAAAGTDDSRDAATTALANSVTSRVGYDIWSDNEAYMKDPRTDFASGALFGCIFVAGGSDGEGSGYLDSAEVIHASNHFDIYRGPINENVLPKMTQPRGYCTGTAMPALGGFAVVGGKRDRNRAQGHWGGEVWSDDGSGCVKCRETVMHRRDYCDDKSCNGFGSWSALPSMHADLHVAAELDMEPDELSWTLEREDEDHLEWVGDGAEWAACAVGELLVTVRRANPKYVCAIAVENGRRAWVRLPAPPPEVKPGCTILSLRRAKR
jgi:hypothetical protein